jgi:hypothetical protein
MGALLAGEQAFYRYDRYDGYDRCAALGVYSAQAASLIGVKCLPVNHGASSRTPAGPAHWLLDAVLMVAAPFLWYLVFGPIHESVTLERGRTSAFRRRGDQLARERRQLSAGSRPGRGSTFAVYLPRRAGAAEAA